MVFENGRLSFIGAGGALWEGSSSPERGRRFETVGDAL